MSSQPEIENKLTGPPDRKTLAERHHFHGNQLSDAPDSLGVSICGQPAVGRFSGEYGLVLATITFIGFLGLPLAIASQAVTHYIARFHFSGDDARLHGLLEGCRKFLFHITIAGSVAAVILVKPLGDFFNIPRISLTIVALICVLAGLWGSLRDGALPGTRLVQKARLHRADGGGSAGFIRRNHNRILAGR